MKLAHSSYALGVLALLAAPALAQSTPIGGDGMDLPISPVTPENVTPTEPDEPDPRDKPPPVIYGEEIESDNDTIVYVVDVSCSMGWDEQSYTTIDGYVRRGPRIDRAKAELARSIAGLADNFRFNVIAYDCGTVSWQHELQDVNDPNKQAATAWVMGLSPRGATGTGPATALALSDDEVHAVVLLTDGAPNCGAPGPSGHRSMIAAANNQGAAVHVFGISASGSYRAFCQGVAQDNRGNYHDVP